VCGFADQQLHAGWRRVDWLDDDCLGFLRHKAAIRQTNPRKQLEAHSNVSFKIKTTRPHCTRFGQQRPSETPFAKPRLSFISEQIGSYKHGAGCQPTLELRSLGANYCCQRLAGRAAAKECHITGTPPRAASNIFFSTATRDQSFRLRLQTVPFLRVAGLHPYNINLVYPVPSHHAAGLHPNSVNLVFPVCTRLPQAAEQRGRAAKRPGRQLWQRQ